MLKLARRHLAFALAVECFHRITVEAYPPTRRRRLPKALDLSKNIPPHHSIFRQREQCGSLFGRLRNVELVSWRDSLTTDYLGLLIRKGRLAATKRGPPWYSTRAAIERYRHEEVEAGVVPAGRPRGRSRKR